MSFVLRKRPRRRRAAADRREGDARHDPSGGKDSDAAKVPAYALAQQSVPQDLTLGAAQVAPADEESTEEVPASTTQEAGEDGLSQDGFDGEGTDSDAEQLSGEDEAAEEGDSPDGKKKKKPATRRRKTRAGNFLGAKLLPALGIRTGKYLRHRAWPFSRRKDGGERKEPEWVTTTEKKVVKLKSTPAEETEHVSRSTRDVTAHGNAFYDGGPKGTMTLSPNEGWLFVDPNPVATPKGGTLLDERTTKNVTGSLSYSFGDKGDKPSYGGKGRLLVTALDSAGATTKVFDSGWETTLGETKTVTLADLPPDAIYTVELSLETWWAGYTEYAYDLRLTQKAERESTFLVTTTKKKRK
ncbi:MAG TPA: hypothetical protein VF736_17060 [Pyrinomonadaceae bacterium]|jgi:hypothetical protein